jgi:excisionase family DNA binding protein
MVKQAAGTIEKHWRVKDLEAQSGLKELKIRRMIASGEIGVRRVGRCVLIPASEVARVLGKLQ